VAKLLAAVGLSFALLATVDPVAPAVALGIELALLPLFGVGYGAFLRRAGLLLLAAFGVMVTMVIFAAERTGAELIAVGPVTVTTGVLVSALGLGLRLLAVSLPGIMVFATTDPTDLADALVQNARVSPRFAIGALAAFRLVPLLGQEWRILGFARRARGLDAGRNPVAKVRLFASMVFALIVGAIRRSTRLALAMDARGFDAGVPRSVARRQRFGPADWLLVGGGVAIGVGAVAVSVALGTFRPLFS
jgi:energy-coupling factor transport system permease protein